MVMSKRGVAATALVGMVSGCTLILGLNEDHREVDGGGTGSASISLTTAMSYAQYAPVLVTFSGAPGNNPKDWIGVYPYKNGMRQPPSQPSSAYAYQYVDGTHMPGASPAMATITIDMSGVHLSTEWPLPPGDYTAYYLVNDGPTFLALVDFNVLPLDPKFNFTFDPPDEVLPFGGESASITADPVDPNNKVARIIKHSADDVATGTTVYTMNSPPTSIPPLPITTSRTVATARVYLPSQNIPVRLKIEDASNGKHSVETQVSATGAANTWQTLVFDFGKQASGTPVLDTSYTFNKISIFINFNNIVTSDQTYYVDDIAFY